MKKVMIVASHYDDEILGCGGTIAKHVANGDEVYVVYVCTGESVRFDKQIVELRKCHAEQIKQFMGIKQIISLDIPLIMADTLPQLEIVTALENVLKEIEPEVIYAHFHDDINSDHKVIYNALEVWLRPSKMFFIKSVYMYEVFGSTKNFTPNRYVDISSFMETKLRAMAMYTTEIEAQTRSLETIARLGKYRGSEISTNYAEAFYVYYEIN